MHNLGYKLDITSRSVKEKIKWKKLKKSKKFIKRTSN